MSWQQLTLRLEAEAVPRVEALLELAGAEAVAMRDAGDAPVLEPAPGETPLWPEVEVRALLPASFDLDTLSTLLGPELAPAVERASLEPVDDAQWIDAWHQRVEPLDVGGRLRIVPADYEDLDSEPAALRLNMGLAFGTGRHPTTLLCLRWLADEAPSDGIVLDYGCGSGILALAALRLGARFAYAVDIEPQALVATRDNAELNGLENSLWLGTPDELPALAADLVVANILAGPLKTLEPVLATVQPPGGSLVLSGMLSGQIAELTAIYGRHYDDVRSAELDGWGRITARRNLSMI